MEGSVDGSIDLSGNVRFLLVLIVPTVSLFIDQVLPLVRTQITYWPYARDRHASFMQRQTTMVPPEAFLDVKYDVGRATIRKM